MSTVKVSAPIAVRTIDFDTEPVDVVLADSDDGRPYNAVYAIATRGGMPVGAITVQVRDGRLDAKTLNTALERLKAGGEIPAPRPPALSDTPVSVVICTIDGGESALRTIEAVLAGSHQNVEVILVNNRPDSSTLEPLLAEHFAGERRVKSVSEQRPGLSNARNAGLAAATGEIVAFTDDDVVPDGNWLACLLDTFEREPEADCVTGLILPLKLETDAQLLLERFAGFAKGFEAESFNLRDHRADRLFPYAAGRFGSGANIAVRTAAMRTVGGFDRALGTGTPALGGEDLDLFIRLLLNGRTISYDPRAVVWHEHPARIDHILREVRHYGTGLSATIFKQLWAGPRRRRLVRALTAGARLAFDPKSHKNARKGDDFPRNFTQAEVIGMLYGPIAYLRSRWNASGGGKAATRGRARGAIDAGDPSSDSDDPAPIWVQDVEICGPMPDISAEGEDDRELYAVARVLVRMHGMPLGFVTVPLSGGRVTAAELAIAIQSELGPAITRHLEQDELPAQSLTADGLTGVNGDPPCLRPGAHGDPTAFISVVICTFNRPESLKRTIASGIALAYPRFELIVVDNAPGTGGTLETVTNFGDDRVRYVAEPLPGLSRARNRGMSVARGELIAFTDDDVVVDRDWLTAIARAFTSEQHVGCVTGIAPARELRSAAQQYFDRAVSWSDSLERGIFDLDEHRERSRHYPYRTGRFGTGANFAISRSAARAVGGFDEALGAGSPAGGGEDLDYFLRVIDGGWKLAVEPAAIVWHYHRLDRDALKGQMRTYGSGATAYGAKHALTRRHGVTISRLLVHDFAEAVRGGGPESRRAAAPATNGSVDTELARIRRRGAITGPLLYVKGRSLIRGRPRLGIN